MTLEWLTSKPIAHRGLHNEAKGLVENCEQSFAAAIAKGFAIECDIELTKEGEAVVFHDDEVDRLLEGKGAVKSFTAATLKRMPFRQGKDRIQTLHELLEQVAGRTPLVIEIKSLWDNDPTLTNRALGALKNYRGPFALMSFDPRLISYLAKHAPQVIRGITADRGTDPYYDPLPEALRQSIKMFSHLPETKPHFASFDYSQLPWPPITSFRAQGHPVITWTIRSQAEREQALLNSDQVTFENFTPA